MCRNFKNTFSSSLNFQMKLDNALKKSSKQLNSNTRDLESIAKLTPESMLCNSDKFCAQGQAYTRNSNHISKLYSPCPWHSFGFSRLFGCSC
jgi:hypothetical protein